MAETKLIQCRHCGESFIAANARFKVCSRECTLAAHAAKVASRPKRTRATYDRAIDKVCGYCGERFTASHFYRQAHHPSGLSYGCRSCSSAKSARYAQEKRPAYLARRKAWYDRNRAAARTASQMRYWANYGKSREFAWRNSHGIDFTWDEYLLIHDKQDGKCAICCSDESELAKKLAVDHDHATGRVRGLLCDDCNLAIGRLQDSPKILRRALDYLGA